MVYKTIGQSKRILELFCFVVYCGDIMFCFGPLVYSSGSEGLYTNMMRLSNDFSLLLFRYVSRMIIAISDESVSCPLQTN